MAGLRRGEKIAVLFTDDLTLWRELVVARHLQHDRYLAVTADDKIVTLDLGAEAVADIREVNEDGTVDGVRPEDYFSCHQAKGREFTRLELAEFYRRADFMARARGFDEERPVPFGRGEAGVPSLGSAHDDLLAAAVQRGTGAPLLPLGCLPRRRRRSTLFGWPLPQVLRW